MAGEKIEVNRDKIEEEIACLNNLLKSIEADNISALEIEGRGYMRQYMEIVEDNFIQIIDAFKVMVQSTVSCLDDIKDGYTEIDEVTRKAIEEYKKEVLR